MSQVVPYIWGGLLGLVTGGFYFAGLWLTVVKAPDSKRPNQLLVLSFAARLLPTLALMFFVVRKDPGMFVAMLIGFFAIRFFVTNKIAPRTQPTEHHCPLQRGKNT